MGVTPDQIRAARALLRLEQAELAKRAHVSVTTIRRLETAKGRDLATRVSFDSIRRALEQAGAEFIPDGVRRRRSAALFDELRAISLRSAERLRNHEILSDAELYDDNGIPT